MKRLNPKTGLPFKHGDLREDGKLFKSYRLVKPVCSLGFYKECWLSLSAFNNASKSHKISNDRQCETLSGKINQRIHQTKSRCKKLNIPFNLTSEYLESIFPDRCPVFNIELDWSTRTGKTKPNGPSLDRIDPKKGYIIGNVQWLSSLANKMKQDATLEQLILFGEWAIKQSV